MHLLSVDWDFFQDVDASLLASYPDGIDLPTYLTEVVWGTRYASDSRLLHVGCRVKEVAAMEALLRGLPKTTPVVVANSHAEAYNLAVRLAARLADDKVFVVNADMHHDFQNGNDALDCGNWIGKLMSDANGVTADFRWIRNPVSLEMYGISPDDEDEFACLLAQKDGGTSLRPYIGKHFDAVFLARSDSWSPPHLDPHFDHLVKSLPSHFWYTDIAPCVASPRKLYRKVMEETSKQYAEMQRALEKTTGRPRRG